MKISDSLYMIDGQKVFRDSFCAYFDILGFSKKIENDEKSFFSFYLELIKDILQTVENTYSSPKLFETKIFTDNFVIGCPFSHKSDGEIELGVLFDAIAYIQKELANNGIFLRGGIAYSQLYMDDISVFGSALIKAYKLENEKAIYPRIIVSEEVVEKIKVYNGYYMYPPNEFLIDKDGVVFLNYLDIILSNPEENAEHDLMIENNLFAHKRNIVKSIEENTDNYGVLSKFIWCAEYHNHFIETFLNKDIPNIEQLIVPENLFKKGILPLSLKSKN